MKIHAGIFVFFIFSIQFISAQQNTYQGAYDWFFFYHEPSALVEGTGKIYLSNNKDAFGSIYNPAHSSLSDNIRVSYTNTQRTLANDNIFYNTFGIDLPIKGIGTFSLVRQYSDYNQFNLAPPLVSKYICAASFDINYSRELSKGLFAGIGINYFRAKELPIYFGYPQSAYYLLNLGVTYKYSLTTTEFYSHYAIVDASVMNIPISTPKEEKLQFLFEGSRITEPKFSLPQMDHISLGYVSKYRGARILKGMDDLQTDIQVEYSDLVNSSSYNSIKLGAEIKILEILSLRAGYYNFRGDNFAIEEMTYGIGLSLPLKVISGIPWILDFDYVNLRNPYFFSGMDYLDSFSMNIRFEIN